jgi:ubiquinone/menaquinone biosynthesis C-methylase UbiE
LARHLTARQRFIAVILLRQRLGNKNWIRFLFKALVLYRTLHYIFKFDDWHILNIYENRTYKQVIVRRVNELRPRIAVEVGCGLGEIISKIDTKVRIGIDIDKNAIRAARLLNWRRNTRFLCGSLDDVRELPCDEIDALIMINWLHEIPEEQIVGDISRLLQKKQISYLVADEMPKDRAGYKYHHTLRNSLRDWFVEIEEVKDPENTRKIVILKHKEPDLHKAIEGNDPGETSPRRIEKELTPS